MHFVVALHALQTGFVRSLTSHETRGIRAVVELTEHIVSGSPSKDFYLGTPLTKKGREQRRKSRPLS